MNTVIIHSYLTVGGYPVQIVLRLYSPSSLASQGLLVQGLTWIVEACRLLGLWWRCEPFVDLCWCIEGQHLQPEHALEWSDSALQYALCMRGTPDSELDEYCSCCHSKGESDLWWEHLDPSISSWAIRLHMQPPLCPCIRPLCSKEQRLVASCYSRRWLHFRGRRRNWRLIVDRLCSRSSWHLRTLQVELAWLTYRECRSPSFHARIVTLT